MQIRRRNLPHWRQEGASYFITFRLADSLPRGLIEQWQAEKRTWLAARGVTWPPGDQVPNLEPSLHFEFHRTFNRKLNAVLDDGLGACSLRRDPCLGIVRERLLDGDRHRYHLGDFVIMPNHVHLLLNLLEGTDLESPMRWIKGGSAHACNRATNQRGSFWQKESYDHLVRDCRELRAFRKYIRENPKKAGITLPEGALYEAEWLQADDDMP